MSGPDDTQPVSDDYTRALYRKHGLGESPTMAEIEPVATKLLEDPVTALEGAALVMGREVMASETKIMEILATPARATVKFGLLLLAKGFFG